MVRRVGGRQVESVLRHSQAQHRHSGSQWGLSGRLLERHQRWVLVRDLAARLVCHQDKLQALLLLLKLGYFSLQLGFLLLQYICLLWEQQTQQYR